MKYFFTGILFISTLCAGIAQSLAMTKRINAQDVYLRTPKPFLLDSIEMDLPSEGTLWSKFDGYTRVSKGDVITLATHLSPQWQTNDGNVSTYALDSTHFQKTFSHSRTWKVEAGKQKIFAMAHNWTDRLGTGYADVTGSMTVVFIPDEEGVNSQNGLGFYIYPFDFKTPERVIKSFEVPPGDDKYFCVSYDGSHFGLAGDRIDYQFSTDTLWSSDLPHKELGFTSIYNSRNISMQTCFERDANSTHLYLLGNKTAGNLNTKENAVYSNLVFHDSAYDISRFESFVNLNDTVVGSFDYKADVKGKLLIRTTGSASAANEGSLIMGLTQGANAQLLDTAIVMQSYSVAYEKEYFSFSRLVDVVPGMVPFHVIAKRSGSSSDLLVSGEIFYQFFPDAIVSSVEEAIGVQAVSIYPNPGNQVLNIAAESGHVFSKMSVFIFDTHGKMWMEDHGVETGEMQLNVSKLPAALYHVVVQGDGKYSTHNYIHE
ncbi:MAG TPA: T9SS type A sorting domain-containing protein [Saprospiraceae bacterium]|nr:T9SS type A sorting domain-containing protein [Saprospiraceae bacterium]